MGAAQQYSVYEIDETGRPRARAAMRGDALHVVLLLLPRLNPDVLRWLRCDEIGAIQRRQLAASKVVWTPELEAEARLQGMSGPSAPVIDGGVTPDDDDEPDEPDEPTTLHEGGRS